MKIVYTTHQFLPDYYAGTEILTYNTAKEILRRGHDVRIFTGYPVKGTVKGFEAFDRYQYDGISVERFFYSNRSSIRPRNPMEAEYNNLFFADYFRKRLQIIKPDIVHFYHLQRLSASAIDVCMELGIPTVFTATDFWLVCPTNQLLLPNNSICLGPDESTVNCLRHMVAISQGQRVQSIFNLLPDCLVSLFIKLTKIKTWNEVRHASLVRALAARPLYMKRHMNHLNMVLVATRFMSEILSRFGLEARRVRQVPFGIDHTHIPRVSAKGTEKQLRIGFIGTLYHHKGAHVLLEAVRLLPTDLPLKVKIYGSLEQFLEYANSLRSIARNDQRIEFCGIFPNYKIGEIFYDLDVLIVPSLWYENTPLVLYSAQAAKVPIVATNLGGMNEVVTHAENGLLFEKGDVKGLSGIIRMLCNDRLVVKNLSDHARPPKSIPVYVDELEQIYDDVINCRTLV